MKIPKTHLFFRISFLSFLGLFFVAPLVLAGESSSGDVMNDPSKDFNSDTDCWVLIFDGENFRGRRLGIVGEVEMENMAVNGIDWSGEIDSAMVGRKMRVEYYSEKKYKGRERVLLPGAQFENINRIRFGNQMRSLKTKCVSSSS